MSSRPRIRVTVETLQTIVDAIPMPMFLIDRDHRLVLVNDAMCAMAGYPRERLLNRSDYPMPQEQVDVFWRIDDEVFATGHPNENEEVATVGDGTTRVILTRKRLVRLATDQGGEDFILAMTTDVTRYREAESRAQYLAQHDPLTGLANRALLHEHLAAAIREASLSGGQFALLLMDVDDFKRINDEYGHLIGDEVLRVVASRASGVIRLGDMVSRFGGDEFCLIQKAGRQPEESGALAKRLNATIAQPIAIGPSRLVISVSIGIAIYPDDGDNAKRLFQRADEALYAVKDSGKSGFLCYNGALDAGLPPF